MGQVVECLLSKYKALEFKPLDFPPTPPKKKKKMSKHLIWVLKGCMEIN
jgi:hypothetical protein